MIDKKEISKHGIKIVENKPPESLKNKILQELKRLIPESIDADGQLNYEALKDIIDISQTTSNNKGYELTFAGKGLAKAKASSETILELQAELSQSKDFDITQNAVIRGDNLEVLKILKQNYFEQIKMIYIDPPYNTKSDNFIYNDNFKKSEKALINDFGLDKNTKDFLSNVYGTKNHSGWLAFMYPRLKLARDLLKEDGVIFISIDDNEQANLKLLCDEIFGAENFLGQLVIKNNPGGRDYGGIAVTHEYIIVYAKTNANELNIILDQDKKFDFEDALGKFNLRELRNRNTRFNDKNRPNLCYPFYVNPNDMDDNRLYAISLESKKDLLEVMPLKSEGVQTVWRWGKEKVLENININVKAKRKADNSYMIVEKYRSPYKRERSIWDETSVRNEAGSLALKNLFNQKVFDYPKSTETLKRVILLGSSSNDLILDFFAGSGTTGDAVMQLNNEDGGNRKFILVQWDEAIKENSEAYRFCTENNLTPVISSITIERLNRAGAKLQNANVGKLEWDNSSLDIGYKVFSLTPKPKIMEDNHLLSLENQRNNSTDTLYNMLCATGKPLHTPVQELVANYLYMTQSQNYGIMGNMNKAFYLLAMPNEYMAKIILPILKANPNSFIYIDGYSEIGLQTWLNLGIDNKDNMRVIY